LAVREGAERGFDEGLAFGARNERGGGDGERKAPEFAVAKDEGERLTGEAARDESREAGRRRRPFADEAFGGAAEGVRKKNSGLVLGGGDVSGQKWYRVTAISDAVKQRNLDRPVILR
jgi:hypothetical protein